jgi:hypothetical protein
MRFLLLLLPYVHAALRSKSVQPRISAIIYSKYIIIYNLEVKTKKIDFYFYSKRLPQTNQPTNQQMSLYHTNANIQNYTQHMPKMQYLTERQLLSQSITGCMLDECEIRTRDGKKVSSGRMMWDLLLVDIWKSIPRQKLLENTTFNFKENLEKGYYWCREINLACQYKDQDESLKEIITLVKANDLTIDLSIKVSPNNFIGFKIE